MTFKITADTVDKTKTFDCNAVLYDSIENKVDEKPFSFNATDDVANIISVDNQVPAGHVVVTRANGE